MFFCGIHSFLHKINILDDNRCCILLVYAPNILKKFGFSIIIEFLVLHLQAINVFLWKLGLCFQILH